VDIKATTNAFQSSNNINFAQKFGLNEQIEPTRQGKKGDCWLLSAVNSLSFSQSGQKLIDDMLEYGEKNATVHIYFKDYNISQEEYLDALIDGNYAKGDGDMIILELAIGKMRSDIKDSKLVLPKVDNSDNIDKENILCGGLSSEAMYYLTGNIIEEGFEPDKKEELLDDFIQSDGAKTLNAGFAEDKELIDLNDETVQIYSNHVYSVKTADNESVSIVDPHDSSKEIPLNRADFLANTLSIWNCEIEKPKSTLESFKQKISSLFGF